MIVLFVKMNEKQMKTPHKDYGIISYLSKDQSSYVPRRQYLTNNDELN